MRSKSFRRYTKVVIRFLVMATVQPLHIIPKSIESMNYSIRYNYGSVLIGSWWSDCFGRTRDVFAITTELILTSSKSCVSMAYFYADLIKNMLPNVAIEIRHRVASVLVEFMASSVSLFGIFIA